MTDLITAAQVQAYLGLASVPAQFASLVSAVSAFVRQFCSRDFTQQSYNETYNTVLSDGLPLRQLPIVSVSSVTVMGIVVPPATSPLQYGYLFDENQIYLTLDSKFPLAKQSTVVAYTAGYSTIPNDLQQACIEMVALEYKRITNIGYTSQTLAGQTVTGFVMSNMPAYILNVLNNYRRMYPA